MTVLDQEHWTALQSKAHEALARKDFQTFCERMDPHYVSTKHTRLLCKYLQALADREISKLMIFMPPRHGKTYHTSERFPAWFEGRNPSAQIILASYTIDRALASSRRARSLLKEPEWPFPDVQLDPQSQAVGEWRTSKGGVVKSAGVGGSMTGFGAHLLGIDDPIKDRAEANSQARRDTQWLWYQEVAKTRLMAGGLELIPTTRWHEDDIPGRILNSAGASKWTVLNLPAIAEENDPLGRALGEALAPELGIEIPRVDLGEISHRAFEALYQGHPTPAVGDLFRREWFRYFDFDGQSVRMYDPNGNVVGQFLLSQCRLFQIVDPAISQSQDADYFVMGTFALAPGGQLLVIDWLRDRIDGVRQIPVIRSMWSKWRAGRIGIEAVAYQWALIQQAIADGLPVAPIKREPRIGKDTRALTAATCYEAGAVYHLKNAAWVGPLEQELIEFPGGKHDDQVDVMSDAASVRAEALMKTTPLGVRVG